MSTNHNITATASFTNGYCNADVFVTPSIPTDQQNRALEAMRSFARGARAAIGNVEHGSDHSFISVVGVHRGAAHDLDVSGHNREVSQKGADVVMGALGHVGVSARITNVG